MFAARAGFYLGVAGALVGCGETPTEVVLRARVTLESATIDITATRSDRGAKGIAVSEPQFGSSLTDENGSATLMAQSRVSAIAPTIEADAQIFELTSSVPAPHRIVRPSNGVLVRRLDFETMLVVWDADEPVLHSTLYWDGLEVATSTANHGEILVSAFENGQHRVTVCRWLPKLAESRGPLSASMSTSFCADTTFELID